MDLFDYVSRYFWAFCLVFSGVEHLFAERRLRSRYPVETPNYQAAARHLRWFHGAANLPWLIMGVGMLTGMTPHIWYYFRPQDLNPFVVAWLGCCFLLAVTYAIWIFRMDGLRKMRQYELLRMSGKSVKRPVPDALFKLLAALGPLFVLLWIFLVASMDVPLPTNALGAP